jgi:inosose dehydratase
MKTSLLERVAGAPITWGVSEVLGWGHQLDTDVVLSEMARIGLRATEVGPQGFLPADPERQRAVLASHGLHAVGGFVPVVLHEPSRLESEMARVTASAEGLSAVGADVLVFAAAADDGYESTVELGTAAWDALFDGIERLRAIASDRDLTATLHPHVGTVIEREEHVERVLRESATLLCLDTGHLMVGGADPLRLARAAPDRIGHVHLKDVDDQSAQRLRAESGYRDAVKAGLYRPLGAGDVDVEGIVRALEGSGYQGWYVLEQDAVLDEVSGIEGGPTRDAETSMRFLTGIAGHSDDRLSFVGVEEERGRRTVRPPREVRGGMGCSAKHGWHPCCCSRSSPRPARATMTATEETVTAARPSRSGTSGSRWSPTASRPTRSGR